MALLIPLLAIAAPFLFAGWLIATIFKHRERMARLKAGKSEQPKALAAATEAVEERLRNLESIVCSVDFELNAKLNRLATSRMLPAPGAGSAAAAGASAKPAGILAAGQKLANRFVIERQLGAGGMGSVYLARDEQLGEVVALKVIAGLAVLDPAATDRFRREASAARRISHPNVVRLHDIGEADGTLFLSMEYVAGQSLAELITRHGVLPVSQVREFAIQICDGLEAAHAAAVVHRDLKPSNIIIDPNRGAKIIDFGLARLSYVEGMTATNMIVGTPEYMAPEQIRGGTIDARTDIYALGAVLYHAVCGRPPFTGQNPIAIGLAHASEPPRPLRELRPEISEAWESVILRCLQKDQGERFATASELRDSLPAS